MTLPNVSQRLQFAGISWFLLLAATAFGQSSYPMLMSISPVAAQTGAVSEHTIESRYTMFGASRIFISGAGVQGEVITPMELDKNGKEPSLTTIKVRFTVDGDALPGVRDVRLIGPWGASTLGQLVIARDPVISESGDNNTQEKAQAVTLPATICGAIERAEDVDVYRLTVTEPVSFWFHCRAMRLEDKIHDLQQHIDPILTIKSSSGNTVAAADNTYAADPFLFHEFTQPGDYFLEVRDVRYQGNKYWNYSIEISSRPYVSNVHPVAIQRSADQINVPVQLVGLQLPENPVSDLSLGTDTPGGLLDIQVPVSDSASNPVSIVTTDLPVDIEALTPNDALEQAQPLAIGSGICGKIETESDADLYRFEAQKGDRLTVEVIARRLESSLDPIIGILDQNGKRLTESDDLRILGRLTSQDSQIENWTVPADGNYTIEVRDVHLRGGDSYVYFLKLIRAEPDFELVMDSDKTNLFPGTAGALFVRVNRKNGFTGEINLSVDGLPPGVTATAGRILETGSDGCIIFEAAPDALPVAGNITVKGAATITTADGSTRELVAVANPMQEIYMPGGGRSHWPVQMHTVALGAPTDLREVKISTRDVRLKQGESTTIEVEIVRAEGFDKNVTLDMLFQHLSSVYANSLPKGVTIDAKASKTLLTGQNSKGSIVLRAAADAPPVQDQICSIMANVSINFVMKGTYSSPPVRISVEPK